ncbi:MAG TPA: SdrD B-like domain-containing protein, partial [Accumulibacter sp.]|uniref:SdrD B-like domain-containing protein n=1 Tax=Accumulibacter sp. TaxID=2053492 RepID=UPI002C5D825A
QQTDANGNYLFTNLNPGTYSVSFVAPAGYLFTQQDIGADASDSDANPANGNTIQTVLDSGESDRTWDAGLVQRAHIGDRIWEDNNANGQQDAGENGIAGVTVNLKDANGNVVGTTTTDANGVYGFDVLPGTYSVAIVPPSGYVVTSANVGNDASDSDINSATNSSGSYTLVSGEVNNTVDGGLYRLATIGDRVWYDNNGNGVQDAGEGGVAGVNVHLRLAGSTTLVSQTTTDANGNYLFTNVTPGDYFVDINEATLPAGYVFTTANATSDAADSDVINGGGWMENTTLTSGEDDRTWDAGIMQPRASIGNYVWEDSNFNGVQDAGESGLGGVTVKLLNSGGSVVGTTTTDAAGQYLFSNLTPGDYKVQVVAPGGYYATWSNIGDDALDSDIVLTDGSMSLTTLSAGENDLTWDAGLYRKAEIGDRVWLDNNGNGVQDAGETGVANVTVSLKNSSGTVVATQQTDANGNYLFSGLNPGTYSIQVSAPAGYSFTAQDIGGDSSDSDVNSSGNTVQTFLTSGESDRTWDAGLLAPKASIGNFVWEDRNYNGIQDAGEAGIGGVTVRLLNSSGSVVGTTTTDGAGQYLFSNLTSGDYRVQVVAPSGYYLTKSNQGANDAVDSDADSSGNMSLTNLSPGENDLTWDAGLYRKASIGDRVWDDFNSNGIQDSGEYGIRNCKVWLYSGSSGAWIASTYTDYYGNYKFTNLDPGSYYLWFDKSQAVDKNGFSRANWNWTYRDVGYNDAVDSDLISNGSYTGYTAWTTLDSGENDMTWDAGICPIAIDLNGDGVHTVARADSGGKFDLFGNGNGVASGWLSGSDGFLAVDRNGNGAIDNIGELFGGNAVGAGFAQLASFDSNADGVVNAADAGFADLKVWQDANGNHQTDSGELMSLAEAGVVGLFVDYTALPFLDANHNLHLERGVASMADGSTASMTDVYFNVALADAAAAGVQLSTMAELLGDAGGVAVDVAQANPANDAVFADAPPVIDQGWLFA